MRINMLQTIRYYYYYLNKSVFMYVYAGTVWQSIYIYTHNETNLDIYILIFNYIKEKL